MDKKKQSPFTGRWRIVSMSAWEDDYLDEEVQAFIERCVCKECGARWPKLSVTVTPVTATGLF